MREIVGFVMGAAAGAAGALFATSPEGRALLERLRDEARPEVERASTEWEPVLREVARAVRLAARELETASADLRTRIGDIAEALPDGASLDGDPAGRRPAGLPSPRMPGSRFDRSSGAPAASRLRPSRPPAVDEGAAGPSTRPSVTGRRRRPARRLSAAASRESTMRRFIAQVIVNFADDPDRPLPLLPHQRRLHRPVHRRAVTRGRPSRSGRTRSSRSSSWPSSWRWWGRSSGPIVLVLTGRLLLRSMGLILIVVNVAPGVPRRLAGAGRVRRRPADLVLGHPDRARLHPARRAASRSSSASIGPRST